MQIDLFFFILLSLSKLLARSWLYKTFTTVSKKWNFLTHFFQKFREINISQNYKIVILKIDFTKYFYKVREWISHFFTLWSSSNFLLKVLRTICLSCLKQYEISSISKLPFSICDLSFIKNLFPIPKQKNFYLAHRIISSIVAPQKCTFRPGQPIWKIRIVCHSDFRWN